MWIGECCEMFKTEKQAKIKNHRKKYKHWYTFQTKNGAAEKKRNTLAIVFCYHFFGNEPNKNWKHSDFLSSLKSRCIIARNDFFAVLKAKKNLSTKYQQRVFTIIMNGVKDDDVNASKGYGDELEQWACHCICLHDNTKGTTGRTDVKVNGCGVWVRGWWDDHSDIVSYFALWLVLKRVIFSLFV